MVNYVGILYHVLPLARNMNFTYRLKQMILFAGDLIVTSLALFLSLTIRQFSLPSAHTVAVHLPLLLMLIVVWAISNYINGLYELGRLNQADRVRRLSQAAIMSFFLSVVAFYGFGNTAVTPKTILLLSIAIGYTLFGLWRLAFSHVLSLSRLQTKVIMVGYDEEAKVLTEIITANPGKGYAVVAIFDPSHTLKSHQVPEGISIHTNLATLRAAITNYKAQLVVPAPSISNSHEVMSELYELLFWPVQINEFSSLYEVITGRVPASSYSDSWFITNLVNHDSALYESVRRLIDFVAAIILGIIALIFFPFIAAAIRYDSTGPIIFKQVRVGWRSKHFFLYKFRTMYALAADGSAEKGSAQFAETNDSRITKVGNFLRKTRLDELPQAWNLFKGDITLIGPRPERPEIVQKLENALPYYHLRLLVKPGMTGWAAINQHYAGTLEEAIKKLQYDLFYIKNRSLLLDMAIVLKTVNVILRMMGR